MGTSQNYDELEFLPAMFSNRHVQLNSLNICMHPPFACMESYSRIFPKLCKIKRPLLVFYFLQLPNVGIFSEYKNPSPISCFGPTLLKYARNDKNPESNVQIIYCELCSRLTGHSIFRPKELNSVPAQTTANLYYHYVSLYPWCNQK